MSGKIAVTLVVEVLPKDMLGANGEHKFLTGLLRFVVQSYFAKGEQSVEAQLAEEGLSVFFLVSFLILEPPRGDGSTSTSKVRQSRKKKTLVLNQEAPDRGSKDFSWKQKLQHFANWPFLFLKETLFLAVSTSPPTDWEMY